MNDKKYDNENSDFVDSDLSKYNEIINLEGAVNMKDLDSKGINNKKHVNEYSIFENWNLPNYNVKTNMENKEFLKNLCSNTTNDSKHNYENSDYNNWDLRKYSCNSSKTEMNINFKNSDLTATRCQSNTNTIGNWNETINNKSSHVNEHRSCQKTNMSNVFRGESNSNFYNATNSRSKKPQPISTYIPPDFDENFDSSIEVGINFEKYNTINVQVNGINVPCHISSFEHSGLHEIILQNLKNCNYNIPTPIQKYAIPIIKNKRDMIASAQTGSGKTAAFLIPILNDLLISPSKLIVDDTHCEPQVLIVSPTRELAIQLCEVTTKLSKNTGIKSELLYGGTYTLHQKSKILRGVHIIVATPGRLIDFKYRGLITFSSLRYIVLDEADRMLDMGFQSDIERILNDNTMVLRAKRSTLMFSATLPSNILEIAHTYLKPYYISISVGEKEGACKDVIQTILEVPKFSKKSLLLSLLNEIDDCQSTIVFVEQRRQADFIAAFLCEMDFPSTSIHGDRLQFEREKALKSFKEKQMKILVATAVAARGLDIMGVTMVVNYDLPKTVEEYVHRIGRTGRLGNFGKAISFFDPAEDKHLAPHLVKMLNLSEQEVPDFLFKYVHNFSKILNH